jgi:hypothetical protein
LRSIWGTLLCTLIIVACGENNEKINVHEPIDEEYAQNFQAASHSLNRTISTGLYHGTTEAGEACDVEVKRINNSDIELYIYLNEAPDLEPTVLSVDISIHDNIRFIQNYSDAQRISFAYLEWRLTRTGARKTFQTYLKVIRNSDGNLYFWIYNGFQMQTARPHLKCLIPDADFLANDKVIIPQ